jgi:hypothetical protein
MVDIIDSDAGVVLGSCLLSEFLEENDFSEEEREECAIALRTRGWWNVGGGAAPGFRIELVAKGARS